VSHGFQCSFVNAPFGDAGLHVEMMPARGAMLFDLGDLHALSARKLMRVDRVFVSHAHMDHFIGFDALLRQQLDRDATLRLFGPPGFIDQVEHKLLAYTWNLIRSYQTTLVLDVAELAGTVLRRARFVSADAFGRANLPDVPVRDGVLIETEALRVRCVTLDHDTPCLAFALEEADHVAICRTRLDARGLAAGPWLRDLKRTILQGAADDTQVLALRQGADPVVLSLGALRDVAVRVPGQRIAYVTDLRFTEANAAAVARLARGADILFIETTFLQEDAEQAARRNHLTAHQAGLIARRAGVKRIEPFHFSPRYEGRIEALRAEAEQAFRGSVQAGKALHEAAGDQPPAIHQDEEDQLER
jgi:ribonuclease Z